MASGAPTPEYHPKVASSRVSSAAMTVAAENVIDSPTRASAWVTASRGGAAGPQFLPEPEDQEQAVVGARADSQDEH